MAGQFGFNIDENPYDIEYPLDTDAECGFTGDVILDQDATPGEDHYITIQQNKPFPLTVLGLFYRGETED